MASSAPGSRLRLRPRGRWTGAAFLALAGLVGLVGSSVPLPSGAAEEEPVVGRDELIGKLIAITGFG